MKLDTQKASILSHLKQRKGITALEALKRYGCFRLAARIHEIKCDGVAVQKVTREVGHKRVAQYWLVA